ncbi:P2 family phage contractile tail tube protein [Paraburkholderia graminis]|uniref:phage major tail tube protein n=1 Tax=Paraburkholderia graminis TaxID=60548 RepID=UPI002864AE51|nr:phage major tail tube protein [Paraburkholderia graminis]MDR6469545.1 P2 family phage contractile tail tube protein [Paraburkholderia graminis]
MALPKKLKNFNLFQNGENFAGQIAEVTPPKLTRKMEAYRGGGMNGPIDIDQGQEGIVLEWTAGGFMRSVCAQYGITKHDGVQLRFAGGYRAEDSTKHDSIEIVVRGRHKELDFGNGKPGDDTAFKVSTTCSYYKLTINGETVIEIDLINMVENVNGEDLLADLRKAIGL